MSYQITQPSPGQLHVEISGVLSSTLTQQLWADLLAWIARQPSARFDTLLDLRRVVDCSPDARAALVQVQKLLSTGARRTAYVANRPRLRGVALWVLHASEDAYGRAVATPEQASAWFQESRDRGSFTEQAVRAAL